jgi:RimJ/RimL family protein N-acetyltransferase
MAQFEQLSCIDSPEIIIIPLTIEYANSMYDLINKNCEFLSQNADLTGTKYRSAEQFAESIRDTLNTERERYSILFNGVLAGSVNLTPLNETSSILGISYWIGQEFGGHGIAADSARMLSDQALRRDRVEEVVAATHPENLASKRTLVNAGFMYLGIQGIGENESLKYAKTEISPAEIHLIDAARA